MHLSGGQIYNSDGSPLTRLQISDPNIQESLLTEFGIRISNRPLELCLEVKIGPDNCSIALIGMKSDQEIEITKDAGGAIFNGVLYPIRPDDLSEILDWLSDLGIHPESFKFVDAMTLRGITADAPCAIRFLQIGKESVGNPKDDFGIVNGKPYPYQVKGIRYLQFMQRAGLGCVLADEMGLGKTLQVIGFLASQPDGVGKSIIIAPATLLENWKREFERFAPSIRTAFRKAGKRDFELTAFDDVDVLVTSYDTLVADVGFLSRFSWNNVILDEAQYIKNPGAKRTKAVKRLTREFSLAVSGTPFENHLTDTWSLVDFVSKGYLGSLKDFEARYSETIETAESLAWVLEPLILRRLVVDVAPELPERIDIPIFLEPAEELLAAQKVILDQAKQSGNFLPFIQKLRTLAAHSSSENDDLFSSPKFSYLKESLWEVLDSNEKALVFASFNDVAAKLSNWLEGAWSGTYINCINGSTPMDERQKIIDAFSASKRGVLVLNPQAAGVGLNITAASHVFHFNPEWNPSLTEQASKRAHRNGQTRPVAVHYLFYSDTIEELVATSQELKIAIGKALVPGVLLPLSEKEAVRRLTDWGKK